MAKQRVNWLRSLGIVEKRGDGFALTDDEQEFVDRAVAKWADLNWTPSVSDTEMCGSAYDATVYARSVDPEFRAIELSRHDRTCLVSGVDHPGFLDVVHVLSWSDFPEHRADLSNVHAFGTTHHAAFDQDYSQLTSTTGCV